MPAPNGVALVHLMEGGKDVVQGEALADELVHLDHPLHVLKGAGAGRRRGVCVRACMCAKEGGWTLRLTPLYEQP